MVCYPLQVIALFVRIPSSVIKKLENFVVKENHVLKLELKQVVKKLKEDPRNVLVWEEQDQADQKKISEQTKKCFFQYKETRDKISPNLRDAALN